MVASHKRPRPGGKQVGRVMPEALRTYILESEGG